MFASISFNLITVDGSTRSDESHRKCAQGDYYHQPTNTPIERYCNFLQFLVLRTLISQMVQEKLRYT